MTQPSECEHPNAQQTIDAFTELLFLRFETIHDIKVEKKPLAEQSCGCAYTIIVMLAPNTHHDFVSSLKLELLRNGWPTCKQEGDTLTFS